MERKGPQNCWGSFTGQSLPCEFEGNGLGKTFVLEMGFIFFRSNEPQSTARVHWRASAVCLATPCRTADWVVLQIPEGLNKESCIIEPCISNKMTRLDGLNGLFSVARYSYVLLTYVIRCSLMKEQARWMCVFSRTCETGRNREAKRDKWLPQIVTTVHVHMTGTKHVFIFLLENRWDSIIKDTVSTTL